MMHVMLKYPHKGVSGVVLIQVAIQWISVNDLKNKESKNRHTMFVNKSISEQPLQKRFAS
jgi:hypothetical protein